MEVEEVGECKTIGDYAGWRVRGGSPEDSLYLKHAVMESIIYWSAQRHNFGEGISSAVSRAAYQERFTLL